MGVRSEGFSLASGRGRGQMVGGGTDPPLPSRSVIPPIYPRCRAGRELDSVVTSHCEFLTKLEQQLELQGELVRKMVSIQEEILRKLG